MIIVEKNIAELREYENNPRHNEKAVDAVAASIKEFGFKVPIVIDENDVIVAGHTRRKAAEKLGMTLVPCIVADDLTPEQIRAFRLADNKVSELAEWDFEKMEQELAELSGFDMTKFGFISDSDDINIDDFFEDAEPKEKEPKMVKCPHCGELFEA